MHDNHKGTYLPITLEYLGTVKWSCEHTRYLVQTSWAINLWAGVYADMPEHLKHTRIKKLLVDVEDNYVVAII